MSQDIQIDIQELDDIPPLKLEFDKKFWRVQSDKMGNFINFKIDKLKFLDLLGRLGFQRYDIEKTHTFIKIENHRIVSEVTRTQIEDAFFDHIREEYKGVELARALHIEDLINSILNTRATLFNEELLYRLKQKETILFNTDTKDSKYVYFQNGYVEVNRTTGINFKNYETLSGYIWKSELLSRTFKTPDYKPSIVEQFLSKICNEETNRLQALRTIIGFLTHNYTNTKIKSIVFTDSRISHDDEPNGRTGKTLFCKCIGHFICNNPDSAEARTYCEINGKDFDPRNKNKYQTASLETRIISINDVKKNFDIEILFNDITEGVTVERKNQHPFRIRPKIIVSTNKTIKIEGDSSKDRFVEFEFGEYFHKNHSPEQEFKHWFFRDWDTNEWNRFDFFMMQSIHQYFQQGMQEPKQINLNARKLRDNTSPDFIEWIQSTPIQSEITQAIKGNHYISKNDFHRKFITTYPDFEKLTQNKLSRWIKYWCKYAEYGITVEDAITTNGREFLFKKV